MGPISVFLALQLLRARAIQVDLGAPVFTLVPPSTSPLNLTAQKTSYSQWRQDVIVEPLFANITHGFFVESGATDGESSSNTVYFERKGWTGLLVEPDRKFFDALRAKHRNAFLFQGGLSPTNATGHFTFHPSYGGGSISERMPKKHAKHDYEVVTVPLHMLMQAMSRKTVDFWSLDIEGLEGAVLEATDFGAVEVGVLLIEMNKEGANNDRIKAVMDKQGFVDIGVTRYAKGGYRDIDDAPANATLDTVLDHVYVNPRYYRSRGLAVPTGEQLRRVLAAS
mmetsp:Transcript_100872/g.285906  ORF Transcript_100872/g.285906 Transcript_100872/m.285906 type:complete len:281 (-) Transcript_100872:51-893(-)